MLGQLINSGTGLCDVLMKINKLSFSEKIDDLINSSVVFSNKPS